MPVEHKEHYFKIVIICLNQSASGNIVRVYLILVNQHIHTQTNTQKRHIYLLT